MERRKAISWFESLPLHGQRIVVTRPAEEANRAASALEALGAEVLLAPTVSILPLADSSPLDAAIARLDEFDWLVFTSGNGVRFFLNRMFQLGQDLRSLGHISLAAIGPGTAQALADYHLHADLVPESFRSEALVEALSTQVAGRKVLLARADRGRSLLKDELSKLADVDQVAVYRNADVDALPSEVLQRIAREPSTGSRLPVPRSRHGCIRSCPRALDRRSAQPIHPSGKPEPRDLRDSRSTGLGGER